MQCKTDTEKARYLEKAKPKLDPRFIVQIENQDFAKYSGLLDLAHMKKLQSLEVEILQVPKKENEMVAICKAHARTAFGESFIDVGDANPSNCNYKVAKHLIRMASTRAKARSLRDLTNIGMTCLEELGDLDEVIGNEEKGTAHKGKFKPFPKKIVSGPNNGNGKGPVSADTVKNGSSAENKEVKEPAKGSTKDEKKTATVNRTETKAPEKSSNSNHAKGKVTPPSVMSEAQRRAVYNLSRRRGISVEELEKMSQDTYGVPLENLSASDASSFIRQLQQSA